MKSQTVSDPPSSYVNSIWFIDARSSLFTKCSRCPNENERCSSCQSIFEGEILLIYDVSDKQILTQLKKVDLLRVPHLSEALTLIGKEAPFEIFNAKRRYYLETKYSLHIYLCVQSTGGNTEYVLKPKKIKYKESLNLLLHEELPQTANGLIEEFSIIQNTKLLPQIYQCTKTRNCKYDTCNKWNFDRHVKICGKSNVKTVVCKQTAYGQKTSVLHEMVQKDYIPSIALNYRNPFLCTFDIETIETKVMGCSPQTGMLTEANLSLLSIAVGSNMPGYKPKCWVRKSSLPEEETRLIRNFLLEIDYLWCEKQKLLPCWIAEAENKLFEKKERLRAMKAKWFHYNELWTYERALRQFTVLDIFGFNSGKFDLPVMIAPLLTQLQIVDSKISVLKKMSSYFAITTQKFAFKDALRFTAPCSYEKYAKMWDAPSSKSLWPYSYYTSVDEMKAAKTFPPLSAFESKLRGNVKPEMKDYILAKREFYRRKLLLKGHPDRICSMYGFLRYYNMQDVQPLAIAIANCFSCYNQYFGLNSITAMSLPSLAMTAMFKNYCPESPLIYSFAEQNKDINKLFRANVYGGLVNVFARHVSTFDLPVPVPSAVRIAPNGDTFKSILALDFTSMYLACQGKEMPTSPGILWSKTDNGFKKNIMCSGHSLKAQQWLSYMQETGSVLFSYSILF